MLLCAAPILVLLLFSAPLDAFHQKYDMGRGHEDKDSFEPIIGHLKLSQKQREQIGIILKKQRVEIGPLENQLNDIRGELRYLWLEPSPDPSKIEAARRESQVIRKQINDIRSRHREIIYRHLTPEQRIKLRDYEEERGYGFRKKLRRQGSKRMDRGRNPTMDGH